MKKFLLATAAILMTGSAYAADAVYEEAPVAVEAAGFTWSGFYVGIHGGYGWADADFTLNVQQSTITSESDLDGFLIGVHAGAQHQFDSNIVLGVEIDVDYRDGDGSGVAFGNGVPSPTTVYNEFNWTGSARLRAGYAMDRWLPYVTGGFAFADYDSTALTNGAPPPFPATVDTRGTTVGWTAGIGAEYAFTDNLIFRAEYRYSDFGDATSNALVALPGDLELTSNDINIGVSVKF